MSKCVNNNHFIFVFLKSTNIYEKIRFYILEIDFLVFRANFVILDLIINFIKLYFNENTFVEQFGRYLFQKAY